MKKTLLLLSVLAVSCLGLHAQEIADLPQYYYRPHQLSLYVMPTYTHLMYSNADNKSSQGDFGVGLGLDYRLFLHQNLGLSVGAQWLMYKTSFGFTGSQTLEYYNNTYEHQTAHALEFPVKFLMVTPMWHKAQFRAAVGVQFGLDLKSSQWRYGSITAVSDGTETAVPKEFINNPQHIFNNNVALLGEVGVAFKAGHLCWVDANIFVTYGVTDMHKLNQAVTSLTENYPGIVATGLINQIHPLTVGLKLGLGLYLPKQKIAKGKRYAKYREQVALMEEEANKPQIRYIEEHVIVNDTVRTIVQDTIIKIFNDTVLTTIEDTVIVQVEQPRPRNQIVADLELNFDKNSTTLSAASKKLLANEAKELKRSMPKYIKITGYTCDLGTDYTNFMVGLERAEAVKATLVSNGIPANIIFTNSEGMDEPSVPNTDETNRQANRKIAIVYHY